MLKKIKLIACVLAFFATCIFVGCAGAQQGGNAAGDEGGNIAEEEMEIYIKTGEECAAMELARSDAARELKDRLSDGDVVFAADDYGGFEKVGSLGFSLPRSDERITTSSGDVMLYQGDNIVIFYGSNSWAYTPLGRIEGLDDAALESFLQAGGGEVKITLSLTR